MKPLLSALTRGHDVVNLQDHANHLRSELELCLLAQQSFDYVLALHVRVARGHAVDAQAEVLRLDLSQRVDGVQTGGLGKSKGNHVECLGESPHTVLFQALNLVGLIGALEAASNLSRPAAVHNAVVLDQVTHNAQSIVNGAVSLVDDHPVAATNEDGDRLGVCAVLNNDHAVTGGAETDLLDTASLAELGLRELRKAGHNAATGGHGDELELNATDPAHSGELVLVQEVVRLIIEAPLANHHVGTTILNLLHHGGEVVSLKLPQLLVLLRGGDPM